MQRFARAILKGVNRALMATGLLQYLSFLGFWLLNLYFVWTGTEGIKWLVSYSGLLGAVGGVMLAALLAGILAALSGILVESLRFLFDAAWFSAGFVSFGCYWLLMRAAPGAKQAVQPAS
ncbi:MAG: hypothetical protein KatS3mg081_2112 [Gemmatimonadales bacterium]|nr:MAG: hypothetical protein KatS3mg081_2112 [Gemmatimonadales bacterium]